jgi:transcriptional regulator with XRE-family HTH domain
MNHIGTNITVAMSSANMSLRELANRSGVSRRAISRMISGEADARWSALERIASELRITTQDLVSPRLPAPQTYTGVEAIDTAVIATLQCEIHPERVDAARQYIAPNYRCSSTQYDKSDKNLAVSAVDKWTVGTEVEAYIAANTEIEGWGRLSAAMRESDIELLGLSWDEEQSANADWKQENLFHNRHLDITHIFVQGARRVVVLTTMTEMRVADLGSDTLPDYVERSGLLLERTVSNLISLSSLRPLRSDEPPLWIRKFWNAYEISEKHRILGHSDTNISAGSGERSTPITLKDAGGALLDDNVPLTHKKWKK